MSRCQMTIDPLNRPSKRYVTLSVYLGPGRVVCVSERGAPGAAFNSANKTRRSIDVAFRGRRSSEMYRLFSARVPRRRRGGDASQESGRPLSSGMFLDLEERERERDVSINDVGFEKSLGVARARIRLWQRRQRLSANLWWAACCHRVIYRIRRVFRR